MASYGEMEKPQVSGKETLMENKANKIRQLESLIAYWSAVVALIMGRASK